MSAMRKLGLLMGSMAGMWLAGCGEDKPAPAPPAPIVRKAAASAGASAAAEKGPAYVYSYNPTGKRDPFRATAVASEVKRTSSACDEPLCQYELDQLTLVAVVTGDSNPIAMVEDSGGNGYLVKRNTRIGKQGGRVTQILRDSITVTELFTAPDGKVVSNPVSLGVKTDKEAENPVDLLSNKAFNKDSSP